MSEIEAQVVREQLRIVGIDSNPIQLALLLNIGRRRASNLYSGKSWWEHKELSRIDEVVGCPQGTTRTLCEQRRSQNIQERAEIRKGFRVEAGHILGDAIARDVWNLANSPELLATVIDERLLNNIDKELFSKETIDIAVRVALRTLGNELRERFPDRPILENNFQF